MELLQTQTWRSMWSQNIDVKTIKSANKEKQRIRETGRSV
jgi:hypothetical protein